MLLKDSTIVKSLGTFTVYNWQSSDLHQYLAYLATSHMWNNFWRVDDNNESMALYLYLTIVNRGSSQAHIKKGLISNIENDITTLWI